MEFDEDLNKFINLSQNYKSFNIDCDRHSRQLYVIEESLMKKLSMAKILIIGGSGVAAEIGKNLILAGVLNIAFLDDTIINKRHLEGNFCLTRESLGKPRCKEVAKWLSNLSPFSNVIGLNGEITESVMSSFDIIVITQATKIGKIEELTNFLHNQNIMYVIAEIQGFLSRIFCDFGTNFIINNKSGRTPSPTHVLGISSKKKGLVTVDTEDGHMYCVGDIVTFTNIKGMNLEGKELKVEEVYSYNKFFIGDTTSLGIFEEGGTVQLIIKPETANFKSFQDSMELQDCLNCFSNEEDTPIVIHIIFMSIQKWCELHLCKNDGIDPKYFHEIASYAQNFANDFQISFENSLIFDLLKASNGVVPPLNAFIGGIASQEVLKACTGKFTPLKQWLLISARDCAPNSVKELQQKLSETSVFVIGAGAIGCEILKNLALMSVATGKGKIVVTDMDSIEKSNLSRQFLFQDIDVGKPKSVTAASAILKMNPSLNVFSYTDEVNEQSESLFAANFFKQFTVGFMAVDNINARRHLSDKFVENLIPYIDSGTEGSRGSFEIFYPHETESYNCQSFTPKKEMDSCTLKHFPYDTSHVILWGKNLFEGCFNKVPQIVRHLFDTNNEENLPTSIEDLIIIREVIRLFQILPEETFLKECVAWAKQLWIENFSTSIKKLTNDYPKDLVENGSRYWSGKRIYPTPLEFQKSCLNNQFIYCTTRLIASTLGFGGYLDENVCLEILEKVIGQQQKEQFESEEKEEMLKSEIMESIEALDTCQINSIQFEKDTDLHLNFVLAAANLRAQNYNLPQTNNLQTKLIAGEIVPAISTTTSVIAGLACLELYKIIQTPIIPTKFRAGDISLGTMDLNFFPVSKPEPKAYLKKEKIGIWDRFTIKEDQVRTINELVNSFKDKYQLNLTIISYGSLMIYCKYQPMPKLLCKDMPIKEVVESLSASKIPEWITTLILTARYDNMKSTDWMPPIHYKLNK